MMHLSKHKLAILALISANIIWGASFPVYKWALTDVPPFTFVFLRFSLGALIILPFTFRNLRIAKEDFSKMLAYSLIGITFAISFLFLGLRLSPSINAPVIYSSGPVILILFSIFYLKEHPRKKVILGTLISLLGVLVVVLRPLLESGFNLAVVGNLFFVLACCADAVSIVILEKIMKRYKPLTIIFWSFLIGSFPLMPLVLLEQQTRPISGISMQGIIGITYGVLLAAVTAHLCFAFGAKYIKTSEIGVFAYVDPIATALVATPLLGEKITFFYILGAFFVFTGIYIAEGRIHYHPFHLLAKKES